MVTYMRLQGPLHQPQMGPNAGLLAPVEELFWGEAPIN